MKRFLVLLIMVGVTGLVVQLPAQKVGTSSMQFLKVMPTARATAMGDAFVTLASGADALFWNPAGMVTAKGPAVSTTLTLWLFDTQQSALAGVLPLGEWGSVGVQLQYVDYGTIEETRVDQLAFVGTGADMHYNPGLTGRTFSPYAYVVGLSYGRYFTDLFSAGLTVKVAGESLWDEATVMVINPSTGIGEEFKTSARTVLFDFGMHYATGYRSVEIGVAVQNFGPQVRFAQEDFPAPLALRLGTKADLWGRNALLMDSEDSRLTLAWDIFQPNDYAQQMHLGGEFSYGDFLSLRMGYKGHYDTEQLTFGGGVATVVAGSRVHLDYSYGSLGEFLGQVHRISLGVQFE